MSRLQFASVLVALLAVAAWAIAVRAAASAADEPGVFVDQPPHAAPGELLVRYRKGLRAAERDAVVQGAGAARLHHFDFIDVDHMRVPDSLFAGTLARLKADPRVLYAEPNWEVHAERLPDDPLFPQQYSLQNTGQTGGVPGDDIHARSAWDVFTGDSTVRIGMIDSGIDYTHPDLAANVWTNPGEIPGNGIDDDGDGYVDDVHGYDFVNNDGDPMDDNGHGTHTAGTVAAVGNNGIGVTGVAWRAQLVAIKFLNSAGSGTIAAAIAGIQYAIAVHCRLTSNSWGGGSYSQTLLDAINAAGDAGQLFVAAAGNSHANLDSVQVYPASYNTPYVVSVAATDGNDSLASFSNFGGASVDIAAPGVQILSTLPGNRYGVLSGTSMACPHVAGVAALAFGQFPTLDPVSVKALLLKGADPVPELAGLVRSGRLNAFNSVSTPDSIPPGRIGDVAIAGVASNTLDLTWTATGDDSTFGRASRYDIRYSTSPITPGNFGSATAVSGGPDPQPSGAHEAYSVTGLQFSTLYYVALRALDEFGNAGPVSNAVNATTLGIPHLSIMPDSVVAGAITGGAVTSTVTLRNTAAGTLDFTIPAPAIAFAAQHVNAPIPYAKGESGPSATPTLAHDGGPDPFGYRWIDSDTTAGPSFNWTEISGTGTSVPLNGDDNLSDLLPLGFTFPFYGVNFDSLRICTNGYVTFNDVFALYANQPLPSPIAPANAIMPFWDDLDFGVTHHAWVWGDESHFIIEYSGVKHFESGGPYTFEVVLFPSGEIRLEYLSLGEPTTSASVGLEDGARLTGLQVVFNGRYLHDSLAVKLMPVGQWATATPSSGRIPAGGNIPVSVRLNAGGLTGGAYHADIDFHSNDPVSPETHLPVTFHVTGAPDISLTPAALDFGDVYVGAKPRQTIVIRNPGTDVLEVGPISTSDSTLRADTTSLALARFQLHAVGITWSPVQVGPFAASVLVPSNDPDTPLATVQVTGRAIPAPQVAFTPDSLGATLLTGASTSTTLHLDNRGAGEYVFRAVPLSGPAAVTVFHDADNRPLPKGAADVLAGPPARSAGGPDAFGYTFRDSRGAGGPTFMWEDARSLGVPIALSGDDAISTPLPFSFDFPFYGESFRSLRVATNGFVTFTGTGTGFSNTSLPNQGDGVPENLLAAFWDDLVFPSGSHAYWLADATHAVIEFWAVPRFGEASNPNTFEISIDSAGTIEYRYLSMTAQNIASATVGIQNAARDDGLQVAFNTPYVADSLAVRFTRPPRWLTVTPDSGRIPPGAGADLAIAFHAATLYGGDYAGHIQIDGNDPIRPEVDVPAHLHVNGVPTLAVDSTNIDFGRVSIGEPRVLALHLENSGSDTLHIAKIAATDARYQAFPAHLDIAPFSARDASLTFAPDAEGAAPATLTVRSNDPSVPERTISLVATGVEPPLGVVSAPPMHVALATTLGPRALQAIEVLKLQNQGGNDLKYHFRALPEIGASAASPPVNSEDTKQSTGTPGALGSGGPDAGGYRWIDSDEPGGVPFQWVDISSLGQDIGLIADDQTSVPLPLTFHFPFYGARFDSVRVCSNGYASFTSALATFTNTPLPNAGSIVPENLLAAFWDDQDFRPQAGNARARVWGDSSRFVIAFLNVPHLTTGGPYNYEIVLHANGDVDYQYLSMGTRLTEATIGLQNGDKTEGLQVAYNAAFVRDHLRVHITRTPPWLSAAPDSGATPPQGADSLFARFAAGGYPDGDLAGTLRIDDNDPRARVRELPVTLHIGVAAGSCRALTRVPVITSSVRSVRFDVATTGADPASIAAATLRVNDSLNVTADPGAPGSASFLVDALELLRSARGAPIVPLRATGLATGVTWFVAADTLDLTRPDLTLPAGLTAAGTGLPRVDLVSDYPLDLAWNAPGTLPVSSYDLWTSIDGGHVWSPLAHAVRNRTWRWSTPAHADSAMIEVVAINAGEAVGAFVTDPFRLLPADSLTGGLPATYALRLRSSNPAFDHVALELALPTSGNIDVSVFDITGARVRTLARGTHASGYIPLDWDLKRGDGDSVPAGIYFVRAESLGRLATTRVAVLR